MKYIKFQCNKYHCDTKFLVQIKEECVKKYYICPECEGMCFSNECIGIVEIDED